jgi:hypothetical protein
VGENPAGDLDDHEPEDQPEGDRQLPGVAVGGDAMVVVVTAVAMVAGVAVVTAVGMVAGVVVVSALTLERLRVGLGHGPIVGPPGYFPRPAIRLTVVAMIKAPKV